MLKTRVTTALLLLAVAFVCLFWLPSQWMPTWAALLLGLMAWEWAGLTGWDSRLARFTYVSANISILSVVLLLSTDFTDSSTWQWLTLSLTMMSVVSVWVFARRGSWPAMWLPVLRWIGVPWLVNFVFTLILVFQQLGVWWLLYALSLVWIMDTGAYFAGKRFGKHKLARLVSPGKTWEGVWGGMMLVAAFSLLCAMTLSQNMIALVGMSVLVAGLSVVGDLFESAMKRQVGVKDSSNLLPGHGGWLDRMDAQLLALPLFWLLWQAWMLA